MCYCLPDCCTLAHAPPPADSYWGALDTPDPDRGLQLLSQAEMLTLDAAMLMVQLNIRLLLEVRGVGAAWLGRAAP